MILQDLTPYILEKGADINAENAYTETPLCLAKGDRHKDIVEILERLGAKP